VPITDVWMGRCNDRKSKYRFRAQPKSWNVYSSNAPSERPLLVAGTAMVLHVMRVKAAAVRHSVWAAVVLLMLVLPIWRGPKASLRVLLNRETKR